MLPDPAEMRWLRERGLEDAALSKLNEVAAELGGRMQDALGADLACEVAWELAGQFVPASLVITELLGQLATGEPMDRQGLEIAGRFLRIHPELLQQLRAAVRGLEHPNDQEIFNSLVARALSVTHEADGRAEV